MKCSTFAAVLVLLAIPTLASAHGGNNDSNVVHACIQNGSNMVRIVGVSDSCRANETPAHWAIQGPQGAPGINGTNGAPGIDGTDGAPGINGTNGTNGTNGIDGTDGRDGQDGAAGPAGPAGPAGAPCLPADPACVGPQGETGPQGPQGPQGEPGARGPAGPGSARYWALVATDAQAGAGVLNSNNNLISAARLRTGSYRITFPASLAFCAIVATIRGAEGAGYDAGNFEFAPAGLVVGYSFIGGAVHTNSLDVQIRSFGGAAGALGALADGLTFNIVVFC